MRLPTYDQLGEVVRLPGGLILLTHLDVCRDILRRFLRTEKKLTRLEFVLNQIGRLRDTHIVTSRPTNPPNIYQPN